MRFTESPRYSPLYKRDEITFYVEQGHGKEIVEWLHNLSIDKEKDYTIEVKLLKKKRSLDANGYFWALVGEIGKKTGQSNIEVYREMVRDCGSFTIVPIRADLVREWSDRWGVKGTGWITEDIGECKNTKGYHNVKSYYGTSTYTTDEMSRLIDYVVSVAKEYGIQTETPEQLARLKEEWK